MKTESRDPLLETVLEDEEIFRAAMLRQTLALARRRRRGRSVRRTLGGAVVLILAAAWLRRETPPPALQPLATAAPVRIIHSSPLASSELVGTHPGLFTSIASAPAGMTVVSSRADAFAVVETRTGAPMLNHLDDQQLLAVFHDEHPALIAPGTADARLVFY